MPKWTPGLWKLWGMQVCTAAEGDEKAKGDWDVVATTYQRDEKGQGLMYDAHLIAAAPELYTALERFATYKHPLTAQDFQIGLAALAKARGEQPPAPKATGIAAGCTCRALPDWNFGFTQYTCPDCGRKCSLNATTTPDRRPTGPFTRRSR